MAQPLEHQVIFSIHKDQEEIFFRRDLTNLIDGSYVYTIGFTIGEGKVEFDSDSLAKTENE